MVQAVLAGFGVELSGDECSRDVFGDERVVRLAGSVMLAMDEEGRRRRSVNVHMLLALIIMQDHLTCKPRVTSNISPSMDK